MRNKTFISSKYQYMLIGGTIAAVLFSLMFMTDTLVAGILLGEKAVVGVNLITPIYSLTTFAAMIISLGVPILYNQEMGAFQREEANRTFGTGLVLSLITGGVLFLSLSLFGDTWLTLYNPDVETLQNAQEYLSWMKFVALVMPIEELLFGMVYADGDEQVSTAGNMLSAAGNLVLSFFLCRSIGIKGLALGSFVSLLLSIAIQFLHFLRKSNTLRLHLAFSFRKVINILKYSMVDSCSYLFLFVFTAVMNRYISFAFGSGMLILVSVISLLKETQLVFDGIGEAFTPIMNIYLGEENYFGVREVWRLARKTANIEALTVSGLLLVFAPQITSLLDIQDPEVFRLSIIGLRIISLSLVFTCHLYLDASYDILIDKIPLGILVSALRDMLLPLSFAMLGGFVSGITGMFVGLMLSQPAAYLLSYVVVWMRYGKENYPLFIADKEKGRKYKVYEFTATPEQIVQLRDQIGGMLKQNDYSARMINRTELLFEELFLEVAERNGEKEVLAECTIEMGEQIRLITKDDGVIFDQTDADRRVESFHGYVISRLTGVLTPTRVHFLALSFNRNVFEIRNDDFYDSSLWLK